MVLDAKEKLGIKYELDQFQVQSLVALYNSKNVILNSSFGSGKLDVNYLGLEVLRVKYGFPDGVGLCLQPLNNILRDFQNILYSKYFPGANIVFNMNLIWPSINGK